MRYPILTVLLAAAPLAALADTYRWTDSHGQVHYTQVPPTDGSKYEAVTPASPPEAAPNQDSINQSLQKSREDAAAQKQADAAKAAVTAERASECKKAKERLEFLDTKTARRLATTNDKGESVRMSEEDFQKERLAAQQRIGQNCN